MTYQPLQTTTSQTSLSGDVLALTEQLARHAHDVWARQRIADGWTWGATRDDIRKHHPGLVPYDQLSETEKQYDRNASLETLKAIRSLGYHIVPPSDLVASGQATATNESAIRERFEALLARLKAAENADTNTADKSPSELSFLTEVWSKHATDEPVWHISPELHQHLARRLLALGAHPKAKEVACAALDWTIKGADGVEVALWGNDPLLRQCLGLALARTGNPEDAQGILAPLVDAGMTDEETLGILARTYKDQATALPLEDLRRNALLRSSLAIYQHAYQQSDGIWTGINVAAVNYLLGETREAGVIAMRVREQCLASLDADLRKGTPIEKTYWDKATLGEAELIVGNFDQAGKYYQTAHAAAPHAFGHLNATRRQARWLLECAVARGKLKAQPQELLDAWLPLPLVVVFSGHMIDRTKRPTARFSEGFVESVRNTIRSWLTTKRGLIGFSSAACGADLLFQEVVQELGGESHIVLPCDAKEFRIDSVDFADPDWSERFDRVLAGATQRVTVSEHKMTEGGVSYEYTNDLLHGLAKVCANQLQTKLAGLVVWDGRPDGGLGGTASVISRWQQLGLPVDSISLASANGSESTLPVLPIPTSPPIRQAPVVDDASDTRIMSMLFGDALNFGKLTEQQVPLFFKHFLGPISKILERYRDDNAVRNTWGDGLYLVFNTVEAAGLCALDICDLIRDQVNGNKWPALGLPEGLSIRLALHTGPVFKCTDPVTNQLTYTGTHVSRAARLEPKTPPGEVYASEAFAALCAQANIIAFTCEYVKQLKWDKHYGTFPTYVLRRNMSSP